MSGSAQVISESTRTVPLFGTEYRKDLQGIRAIAVLLVLLYHAEIPLFSGGFVGVDVFFVLSGFLITSIVVREIHSTARFSLARFYGRRIVRIIPAATIVLIAVAAATLLWMPVTQWRKIAGEIIGSALYASNWQFAASTNYLNAEAPPSPLQHFWSLAVEEQYYLLWPALLLLGILFVRAATRQQPFARRTRQILVFATILMTTITAASFLFSLISMERWPAVSYFITPTRLWELGVGSLLALAVPFLRTVPIGVKWVLLLGGLCAVLGAGIFYNESIPFPGSTALLPVIGTAAIVAGGLQDESGRHPSHFLGHPVLVWFGNISYSLYLWHWPMLIIAQNLTALSPLGRLLVVSSSILPAYFSTRFIEKPLLARKQLRNSPAAALKLGGAAILLSLASAAAVLILLHTQTQVPTPSADAPGAASIADGQIPPPIKSIPVGLTPSLVNAAADNPLIYEDGCHLEVNETKPIECIYGDPDGPTILLTGDSHAAQWFPALDAAAEEHGYRLVVMTKSSCPFADLDIELSSEPRIYKECAEWNANVQSYIAKTHPEFVVTSTLGIYTPAPGEVSLQEGLHRAWEWTTAQGSDVRVIADTPYMSTNVPECLAQHQNAPEVCRTPRNEAFPFAGLEEAAAANLAHVATIDLTDRICPGQMCEPIIGNVLVYRDQHHLSATYSRSLSEELQKRLFL